MHRRNRKGGKARYLPYQSADSSGVHRFRSGQHLSRQWAHVGVDGILNLVRQGDMKPELAWNILIGFEEASQTDDVAAAHHEHDELLARCRGFFEHAHKPEAFGGETAAADSSETHYRETRADDPPIVVLVPCTCVEPFDKSLRYLQQIGDLSDLDPNPYI